MRHSHDDQIRRASLQMEKTGSKSEQVFVEEAPVQLSRTLVNRAIAIRLPGVAPANIARRRQVDGAMREFLRMSRTIQRLPSFGKGRRE